MDKKERKELVGVVGEALEQVVLPRLQIIEDDVKEIKGTLNDHGDSLERIESRQEAESKHLDKYDIKSENHEERIIRLEKEAMFK